MEAKFKRTLIVNSVISLLILCVSSAASFFSIKSLLNSNSWVSHTYEVIYNLNAGESQIISSQNSVRGFLVTEKRNFLQQYINAQKQGNLFVDKVEYLTQDNEIQQKNIKKLRSLKAKFFIYLNQKVQEKKNGTAANDLELDQGKTLMDAISSQLKKMIQEEQRLLQIRTSDASKFGTFSLVLILVAALLSLLITIAFFTRMLKDYNVRIQLYMELQTSQKQTAQRIKAISTIAGELAKGNYEIRINDTEGDALGSTAVSLNEMASALEQSFTLLSDKEWLQSGMAGLNKVMIGEKDLKSITADITEYLADYIGSSAAVLYLKQGDELFYSAGYGYIPSPERERFDLGSGLSGEAALGSRILELKSVNSDQITISYALGKIKPRHIIALPLIDNQTVGVIEFAGVKNFSEKEIGFLSNASHNIAVGITAAQNKEKVQALLEETQSQSEELMAQHTELESINAELEAQSEKLQASEEELRVQQEELEQSNSELSNRGILLEEKNSEIQKKSEALELSTRYKSEFLANMSHELRTPLNSILLLSRLLAENNDATMNEDQVEFAKVIQSSGNGLLTLIDEILDLSKIEAGKMELEIRDVTLSTVVVNLTNTFGILARQKGIEFTVIDQNAPYLIQTDITRLEQVLKNFISNAVKFTEKGTVTLEIKANDKSPNKVSFIVSDTGIGIPKDKQGIIFEAFQQADGSTKRRYGGTGLGLSISLELTKLLEGSIEMKSEPGVGSIFTLTIPMLKADKEIAIDKKVTEANDLELQSADVPKSENYLSAVIPQEIQDDRTKITTQDKVVLIVEDDINFAKTLLDFTRKNGYLAVVCVRGDQALDFALAYKPIGILLDIQLPVKDGWQVMEELKSNDRTQHIPVHIMSSHKVKQKSMLKGAVHFLDKPFAFEKLPEVFNRIENIVNRESHKVIIIEDNAQHARALADFLHTYNINSSIQSQIADGFAALQENNVDCLILDMGIPYGEAYELLDTIKKKPGMENLPVIVFTGSSLSLQEEAKIKKYADSIIIKTANSYQRILDEVSLFLHIMEKGKDSKERGNLNLSNNILKGKKVLVVDDDVRNIYSLTKVLEELKMSVVTALDGREAIKALEESGDIDIVLLDMMMPNMDGYETASMIRQNAKTRNLPVIAVTAKAMIGDREKCIKAGASDYITKPVDSDQLTSLLRVWLYNKL